MAEFLALLCWWVAVGCGETANHVWDLPKGETLVISQEVQSATGTLMKRPAPILGVNFCKRSEYECIEGGAEGRNWGDGGWKLDHKVRYEFRATMIANRQLQPGHECSIHLMGAFNKSWHRNDRALEVDWTPEAYEPSGFMPLSISECAGWAIEARPVQ